MHEDRRALLYIGRRSLVFFLLRRGPFSEATEILTITGWIQQRPLAPSPIHKSNNLSGPSAAFWSRPILGQPPYALFLHNYAGYGRGYPLTLAPGSTSGTMVAQAVQGSCSWKLKWGRRWPGCEEERGWLESKARCSRVIKRFTKMAPRPKWAPATGTVSRSLCDACLAKEFHRRKPTPRRSPALYAHTVNTESMLTSGVDHSRDVLDRAVPASRKILIQQTRS